MAFPRIFHLPGLDLETLCSGNPDHHSAVIVMHGLGVSKEVQLPEIERLRAAGFFAIAVDAPHHGSRHTGFVELAEGQHGHTWHHLFLAIVLQQASEISQLVAKLRNSGKKVCVSGISMGGFVAFAMLRMPNRPDLIAPFIGSPDFRSREPAGLLPPSPAETSGPADYIEQVYPAGLFMVTAGHDTVVDPIGTRQFAERLRPIYRACPEKLEYYDYPQSDHMMRPADWFDAWEKFIERLKREGF
ncbi:MAG TPA: alpha/beta fold hydrolase [Candidatus Rifleibacterium sp.]|nr:alpha/beta fold hydrolase [Candidatus Rifleibacterium sp.]HPT45783.1 alpha/beta fold hydrolase [Candidatus Rifleibacterium sp.]